MSNVISKPCCECGDMSPLVPNDGAHLAMHDCEAEEWTIIQLTLPAGSEEQQMMRAWAPSESRPALPQPSLNPPSRKASPERGTS